MLPTQPPTWSVNGSVCFCIFHRRYFISMSNTQRCLLLLALEQSKTWNNIGQCQFEGLFHDDFYIKLYLATLSLCENYIRTESSENDKLYRLDFSNKSSKLQTYVSVAAIIQISPKSIQTEASVCASNMSSITRFVIAREQMSTTEELSIH